MLDIDFYFIFIKKKMRACSKSSNKNLRSNALEREKQGGNIKIKIRDFVKERYQKIEEFKRKIRDEDHKTLFKKLLELKNFGLSHFLTYFNFKEKIEKAKSDYYNASLFVKKEKFQNLYKITEKFINFLEFKEEDIKIDFSFNIIDEKIKNLKFYANENWYNELKKSELVAEKANFALLCENLTEKEYQYLENRLNLSEKQMKSDFDFLNEIDEWFYKERKKNSFDNSVKKVKENIIVNDSNNNEKLYQNSSNNKNEKQSIIGNKSHDTNKPKPDDKKYENICYKSIKSDDKKYEHVGFKNLGNTCYMNSIMQCLKNSNSFMDYFGSLSSSELLNATEYNSQILINDFINLLKKIREPHSSSNLKVVSPTEFKQKIGQINNKVFYYLLCQL